MTISIVLRLAEPALDAGRLAGEAELVATGERAVVRSAEELIAFLTKPAAPNDRRAADGVATRADKRDSGGT